MRGGWWARGGEHWGEWRGNTSPVRNRTSSFGRGVGLSAIPGPPPQRQRRCAPKLRFAPQALPWDNASKWQTPTGLWLLRCYAPVLVHGLPPFGILNKGSCSILEEAGSPNRSTRVSGIYYPRIGMSTGDRRRCGRSRPHSCAIWAHDFPGRLGEGTQTRVKFMDQGTRAATAGFCVAGGIWSFLRECIEPRIGAHLYRTLGGSSQADDVPGGIPGASAQARYSMGRTLYLGLRTAWATTRSGLIPNPNHPG